MAANTLPIGTPASSLPLKVLVDDVGFTSTYEEEEKNNVSLPLSFTFLSYHIFFAKANLNLLISQRV